MIKRQSSIFTDPDMNRELSDGHDILSSNRQHVMEMINNEPEKEDREPEMEMSAKNILQENQ